MWQLPLKLYLFFMDFQRQEHRTHGHKEGTKALEIEGMEGYKQKPLLQLLGQNAFRRIKGLRVS